MMNKFLCLLLFLVMLFNGGCSVAMALHGKKGPDFEVLSLGQKRYLIEKQFGKPESTYQIDDDNTHVTYAYAMAKKPDKDRALRHLLVVLLTMGLYENEAQSEEYQLENPRKDHSLFVIYDNVKQEAVGIHDPGWLNLNYNEPVDPEVIPRPALEVQESESEEVMEPPDPIPVPGGGGGSGLGLRGG